MLDWICLIGVLLVAIPCYLVIFIVFTLSVVLIVLLGRIGIITCETTLHLLEHAYYIYQLVITKATGAILNDEEFINTYEFIVNQKVK